MNVLILPAPSPVDQNHPHPYISYLLSVLLVLIRGNPTCTTRYCFSDPTFTTHFSILRPHTYSPLFVPAAPHVQPIIRSYGPTCTIYHSYLRPSHIPDTLTHACNLHSYLSSSLIPAIHTRTCDPDSYLRSTLVPVTLTHTFHPHSYLSPHSYL